MDLRVAAIAAVALVGLWCLVVLPAVWLSGTMSQEEDGTVGDRPEQRKEGDDGR